MENPKKQEPLFPTNEKEKHPDPGSSYSTIPGKGNDSAEVSEIKIKDKWKEKMSDADKTVSKEKRSQTSGSPKQQDLAVNKSSGIGNPMTTDQGVKINDDHNTLKAGERGPSLLEDFIMREKITHFDHERIPERVVHARGSAAHGIFEVTRPIPEYTKAKFLSEKGKKTSVFIRFSTVAGERGSTDVPRDARGFAVKFYTEEGNYDLVANNMAPFFIHDAMKFPDLVHSLKPEPRDAIPQAASAHDTLWDFISTSPETMHMIMWLMSDRAIPRSFRMMEGFGVHSFRFINEQGVSSFVKFHLKPKLGMHSLVWDEAQKISGKDSDFHRRDLWDAIASGNFPQWDLGVQIVPEEDEFKFDFDLLDPTKIIPEELVAVMPVGTITLNRNPDNFFAETEQVAFHPGHVVPGIDFSNDPLLQGRLFSYTDTQLLRLGGPNFHEIPINRSICPVTNNQRDGFHRMQINVDETAHSPNRISDNQPYQVPEKEGGFVSHRERVEGHKIRGRSKSFLDHYSQAILFYNSQNDVEKQHIKDAFSFELGKCRLVSVRQNMLKLINQVDKDLAAYVAGQLGLVVPEGKPENMQRSPEALPEEYETVFKRPEINDSPALSILRNNPKDSIATRKYAILCDDGVDGAELNRIKQALFDAGAMVRVVASHQGELQPAMDDITIEGVDLSAAADDSVLTTSCVLFDGIVVMNGSEQMVNAMLSDPRYKEFVKDTYLHHKPIAVYGNAEDFVTKAIGEDLTVEEGIVKNGSPAEVIDNFKEGRFWNR